MRSCAERATAFRIANETLDMANVPYSLFHPFIMKYQNAKIGAFELGKKKKDGGPTRRSFPKKCL